MSLTRWKQTFKRNGCAFVAGEVSVYLSGTTTAARVFDTNEKLLDTAPQMNTDSEGTVIFSLDPDDYPSGQLFDVFCASGSCISQDAIELKNLMILQDTEGGRAFKQVFAQATAPDVIEDNVKEADLFIDTDNENRLYRYNGTNWIDMQDGSIATAASTANWSQVVDDDTNKPDDGADVTEDHTSNNTKYVNGSETGSVYAYTVKGDLKILNGGDLSFYDNLAALALNIANRTADVYISGSKDITIGVPTNEGIHLDAQTCELLLSAGDIYLDCDDDLIINNETGVSGTYSGITEVVITNGIVTGVTTT